MILLPSTWNGCGKERFRKVGMRHDTPFQKFIYVREEANARESDRGVCKGPNGRQWSGCGSVDS